MIFNETWICDATGEIVKRSAVKIQFHDTALGMVDGMMYRTVDRRINAAPAYLFLKYYTPDTSKCGGNDE